MIHHQHLNIKPYCCNHLLLVSAALFICKILSSRMFMINHYMFMSYKINLPRFHFLKQLPFSFTSLKASNLFSFKSNEFLLFFTISTFLFLWDRSSPVFPLSNSHFHKNNVLYSNDFANAFCTYMLMCLLVTHFSIRKCLLFKA